MVGLKTLTVCCPHLAEQEASNQVVVEGGPLTLLSSPTVLRAPLAEFIQAQAQVLAALQRWSRLPGWGELTLLTHAECKCSFLIPLKKDHASEMLDELAQDLRDQLFGHPKVEVRFVEYSAATEDDGRRHSGERLLSHDERELLEAFEAQRRASA